MRFGCPHRGKQRQLKYGLLVNKHSHPARRRAHCENAYRNPNGIEHFGRAASGELWVTRTNVIMFVYVLLSVGEYQFFFRVSALSMTIRLPHLLHAIRLFVFGFFSPFFNVRTQPRIVLYRCCTARWNVGGWATMNPIYDDLYECALLGNIFI